MKKRVLVTALFISAALASSSFAYQPKSTDYVVVPDEPVKENIQVQKDVAVKEQTTQTQDDFSLKAVGELGQYIKIKQDGKYGVMDKNGNIILAPVFQQVNLINYNSQECFWAKANGKVRLYYNTGKLVPETDVNTLTQNTSLLLARDLKPIFKIAAQNKDILYTKIEKQERADQYVYEIKEIPLVKVNSNNVQVAHVEKNAKKVADKAEEVQSVIDQNGDFFTIGRNQFLLVTQNGKIGVVDSKNAVILPAKFDTLELKKPCKHFKTPVFVVSANNAYSIYDEEGRVLAEQIFDKINVYRNGKLYTFNIENGKGILRSDGKIIGSFTLSDDGYKYSPKNKLSIIKPHMVNNLIMTIVNM